MKKIVFVNSVCGHGSTGKICLELAESYIKKGWKVRIAYGRDDYVPDNYKGISIRIATKVDVLMSALHSRFFDSAGFDNKRNTKKFIKWLDEFNPDVIWLHNLHGYYVNVQLLFDWIKSKTNLQVIWTLHDCWAFTGHCTYFSMANCYRWKAECFDCPQLKKYPTCFTRGNVERNYRRKEKCFRNVKKLTIVTPSKWLANLVSESFLADYPVQVRYNEIDRNIFKPTVSNFREKNSLQDQVIILGVANIWDKRKGLQDIISLSMLVGKEYSIVIVGVSNKQIKLIKGYFKNTTCQLQQDGYYRIVNIDDDNSCKKKNYKFKNQIIQQGVESLYIAITKNQLDVKGEDRILKCSSIVCIPRTKNASELAEIYSSADVYINPTYEDNYPTTNLEAQACGTAVITYDTGGCKETLQ